MNRILLYTDKPILSLGFALLLSDQADYEFLTPCQTVDVLQEKVAVLEPDLVVMDLTSEINPDLVKTLRRANKFAKLLIWAEIITTELAHHFVNAGTHGVLIKNAGRDETVECFKQILDGGVYLDYGLAKQICTSTRAALTRRAKARS